MSLQRPKYRKYIREIERLSGVAIASFTYPGGGHLRLDLEGGGVTFIASTPSHRQGAAVAAACVRRTANQHQGINRHAR